MFQAIIVQHFFGGRTHVLFGLQVSWLTTQPHNGMELQMVGIGPSLVGNPKIKIVGWFCVFHLSGPFLPLRDQRKNHAESWNVQGLWTRSVCKGCTNTFRPFSLKPRDAHQSFVNLDPWCFQRCKPWLLRSVEVKLCQVGSPPKSLTRWFYAMKEQIYMSSRQILKWPSPSLGKSNIMLPYVTYILTPNSCKSPTNPTPDCMGLEYEPTSVV